MEGRGVRKRVPRSEPICPKEFLQSWDVHEITKMKPSTERDFPDSIGKKMGISEQTVKELADVCGKNKLFKGNEPKSKVALLQMTELPPEVDLQCAKHQMKHRKQRQENEALKMLVSRHMKYNSLDDYLAVIVPSVGMKKNMAVSEEFMVPQPNVVLTVQISKCLMHGELAQMVREKETFLVLGSQKLTELRDKIRCSSDAVIPGDYSCIPDLDPETLQTAGDIFRSSLFFIDNTFYIDHRLPDNKDYSEPIIKWAAEHMPDTVMKKGDMDKTTFYDLTIRLGHHYLFIHQGNCEHSMVFTDMRLFNSSDSQDIRIYPLPFITRTKQRVVCQGCSKLSARWIVRDSPLIPTDPCYLCRLCFKTLLYTKQGQKASNFKAQHFLDALHPNSGSET